MMSVDEYQDEDDQHLALPPHSIEAEQSLLGAVMLDNSVLDRINGSLASEDFYTDDHRLIFAQAQALHRNGQPVDVTTLHAALDAAGQAEYVGGKKYIGELLEAVPTAANAGHYAGIVRERAESRRVAALALEIHDAAMFSRGLSPGELNERMAVLLRNAEAFNRPPWSLPGPITTAEFNCARLTPDCIVENYLYADVAVIVAPGGTGKTTLLLYKRRSTSRLACRCTGSGPQAGAVADRHGGGHARDAGRPAARHVGRDATVARGRGNRDARRTYQRRVRDGLPAYPRRRRRRVALSDGRSRDRRCRELRPVLVTADPAISSASASRASTTRSKGWSKPPGVSGGS